MTAITYDEIKRIAGQHNIPVTDLIALTARNDPFYAGTPTDKAMGEWFRRLFVKLGFQSNFRWSGTKAHIRRVHYAIVSQDPPARMHNGELYLNTTKCWDYLLQASKVARYLGLVSPDAFDDKKNPEAHVYADNHREELALHLFGSLWEGAMQFPDFPEFPYLSASGFSGVQSYHLEILCEKTTINDIVLPLCSRYGVNYQTGAGELSITAALNLAKRIQAGGKPARIAYISDYDPGGQSMVVALARKLEYFVRTLGIEIDIRLYPLVLTAEQIAHYDLPRTPIKETEKRRDRFEALHGSGGAELDALEATQPGVLATIIEGFILRYYDTTLAARVRDAEGALRAAFDAIQHQVLDELSVEIDGVRAAHERLRFEFDSRMRAHRAELDRVWAMMSSRMQELRPDLDDYPIPQAGEAGDDLEGVYDSNRDYADQILAYKRFQGK